MKYLTRNYYLEQLIRNQNNGKIKLIQGIYAAGKSNLIYNFIDSVYNRNPEANIIFADYSLKRYEDITNDKELVSYVNERYKDASENYLIIDEAQLCCCFEKAVLYFYQKKNVDIYIATSVSTEEKMSEAGFNADEIDIINVYPFSFSEYIEINEDFNDKETLFQWYLTKGGFSGCCRLFDEHDRIGYINGIYSKITGYGLYDGYNIQDRSVLEKIQKYLIDSISKPVSPNRITDNLKARGISANHVTTGRYIKYLLDSFVFYGLKRIDIKTGSVLETMQKYYLADLSIKDRSLVKCRPENGQIYENLVFLELLRRGYKVYAGKLYQKEIDFVAERNNERIYIQICDRIQNTEAVKEAMKSLIQIKDAWPKIIISSTKTQGYIKDGVHIVDIEDWLSSPNE